MGNKYYIDAEEIANALDVHTTTAYRIIKELNEQLKAQGFIIVAGKCPRKYFNEHYYGGIDGDSNE